jgi:hypothetical protein
MEPKEKCNDLGLQPPKKTQLDYKAISTYTVVKQLPMLRNLVTWSIDTHVYYALSQSGRHATYVYLILLMSLAVSARLSKLLFSFSVSPEKSSSTGLQHVRHKAMKAVLRIRDV